jgi:zinc and cadmium transporter
MSLIALVGAFALMLSEEDVERLTLPLVALAAGTLLGGSFFHLLPESIDRGMDALEAFEWAIAGFLVFFVLEQFLHWQHSHGRLGEEEPVTYLILTADGLHNFIGGLAVGGAFVIDIHLGLLAWVAAAAHEVPQELGDFGVLVHGGWEPERALRWNVLSALTFPIGGVLAWFLSAGIDVAFLVPFGAGNFIYIAAADLTPEVKHVSDTRRSVLHLVAFVTGLAILFAVRLVVGG